MDKSTARSLSEALKTHLEAFEEENDIKVTIGSGKFDSTTLFHWRCFRFAIRSWA